MNSKAPPRFKRIRLLEYCKNLVVYFGKSAIQLFTSGQQKSQLSFSFKKISTLSTNKLQTKLLTNPSKEILNKITKFYVGPINKYLSLFIFIFCLLAVAATYYHETFKFNLRILKKTELTHFEIEKTIKNYKESLNSIIRLILEPNRYLEPTKVIRLLKLSYTTDRYISLLPVTWHPLKEPNRFFNIYGSVISKQDTTLIEKLNKESQHTTLIYNKLNKYDTYDLIMIAPAIKQTNQTSKQVKTTSLIGYLKLPVAITTLLQKIENAVLDKDDLVKMEIGDKSIYFTKRTINGKTQFKDLNDISDVTTNFQFAKKLKLFVNAIPNQNANSDTDSLSKVSLKPLESYTISIGRNNQEIITNTLKRSAIYCGIILAIGSIMLLLYNLLERKKAKNLCDDNQIFIDEINKQQLMLKDLVFKLDNSNQQISTLKKEINEYSVSNENLVNLEQQVKQEYDALLHKMQDYLLLKQYNREEELTADTVKKLFAELYKINKDLSNNIVSRERPLSEINLATIVDDLLVIFAPIINTHSTKVIKKLGEVKIRVNELALKQVLLSLLVNSLCFIPPGGSFTISANLKNTGDKSSKFNFVAIEINDDGFGYNDQLLKSLLNQHSNLLPGIANIQLKIKSVKKLVKEILSGDLRVTKTADQGNNIILSLPLKADEDSKVILFPERAIR